MQLMQIFPVANRV